MGTLKHVILVAVFTLAAAAADAQTLSIQGDRFAVDGVPKFLTFMSYYGGMGAPDVAADFKFMRSRGFDGIRLWPNLFTGPQLPNADGSLKADVLSRLLFILDRARDERIIVDVTFTAEHIPGMTAAGLRNEILATAAALLPYRNVLFDIQNERNIYGPGGRGLAANDVAGILAGIKAIDPARIVTASNSPIETDVDTASFARNLGLDVVAYHDPRGRFWYERGVVESMVNTLKTSGRPVYLQEPMTTRDSRFGYPSHDRSEYFEKAIANSKLAGAAAWCFHTDVAIDYREGPALLEDRLRAYPEPEWTFVEWLVPRVTLQSSNGINYVTAESGGGGEVHADRPNAAAWETFRVIVPAGGPIVSGDRVAFVAADGTHFLQAVNGGGAMLRATGTTMGPWETFVVERPDGGIVWRGDSMLLRANDTPWYVIAESGGGRNVMVNSTNRGPWETFTVTYVQP
jgi:hypothetical protein